MIFSRGEQLESKYIQQTMVLWWQGKHVIVYTTGVWITCTLRLVKRITCQNSGILCIYIYIYCDTMVQLVFFLKYWIWMIQYHRTENSFFLHLISVKYIYTCTSVIMGKYICLLYMTWHIFVFFDQKAPKHIFPTNVICGMYMYVMILLY